MDKVAAKYPDDYNELCEDETAWQYGFNSGMLACCRLMTAYTLDYDYKVGHTLEDPEYFMSRDDAIKDAEEEFPMLDS